MASTKKVKADYSPKLDLMANSIKIFLQSNNDKEIISKTHKGIEDFCYNNTERFLSDFLQKVGIPKLQSGELDEQPDDTFLFGFYEKLSELKGECIFLLKDTQDALEHYQETKGRGFGILVNRTFLRRAETEEDYFTLINLVYQSFEKAGSLSEFLNYYQENFNNLIDTDSHFASKAQEVAEYTSSHTNDKSVTYVDLGFQFTFSLFCQAALKKYATNIEADFYSLTTYPWLQVLFTGKYYSPKNQYALAAELQAIEHYRKRISDRGAGALLGFGIGDALGFPAAGINSTDIPKFLPKGIAGFSENLKHPYFSHLKAGQYTDNTSMLILSAEHLTESRGFDLQNYAEKLAIWFEELQSNPLRERWLGPTATSALEKLVKTNDPTTSGSQTTQSCSATYRVIPLGIYYRPFHRTSQEEAMKKVKASTAITHNSNISRAGAVIVSSVIGDLINSVLPQTAVRSALKAVKRTEENTPLLDKLVEALNKFHSETIDWGRKHFGTGSPVYQMLPLAVFIFLKYPNNFNEAILAAANSYRDDTPEEKERLKGLSWEQQLLEAKGGNTDGIAGLAGAFVGAHVGLTGIPKKLIEVENNEKLIELGRKLV